MACHINSLKEKSTGNENTVEKILKEGVRTIYKNDIFPIQRENNKSDINNKWNVNSLNHGYSFGKEIYF